MRRSVIVLALTLAAAYAPSIARANGRFPRAQQIAVDPSDARHLVLRATFGLMTTNDAGKTWRWVCEQAMGFSGAWDPPIAFGRDGSLLIGLTDGLTVTRDTCSMQGSMKGELVSDLSDDLIATSTASQPAALWRRGKDGRSMRLGEGLAGVYLDTIDAAPSKPSRVYATGVQVGAAPEAHLFVSDDSAATLKEVVPVLPTKGRLFLAAIDPHDAMHLFVRQLGDRGSDLLVSGDGGHSFSVGLHLDGAMMGFAIDPSGEKLWVGSADESQGIYVSRNGGVSFTQAAKVIVYCLARVGDDLWVCSEPFRPAGFAIGISHDDGATVAPLATFTDVKGPALCDAGEGTRCQGEPWTQVHASLVTASTPIIDASIEAPDAGRTDRQKSSRCACGIATTQGDPLAIVGGLCAIVGLVIRRARRVRWINGGSHRRSTHPN